MKQDDPTVPGALRQGRVPTYEGRPLARPDEEVVDQGLAFDVGTLVSRRQALRALGFGATAFALAACSSGSDADSASTPSASASSSSSSSSATMSGSASGATAEIPDETAGPYPGDGSNGPDALEQAGIVRSDIRSSFGGASGTAEGVPMQLDLVLSNLAQDGKPFEGAAVYVWHCNREGQYSLYSEGVTDQNFLRGVQVADASGTVRFSSIFPACYAGRWPHIHFEVYPDRSSTTDSAKAIATSQVALPEDVCDIVYATNGYETSVANLSQVSLESDNVFADDGAARQLGTVRGDITGGYIVSLAMGIDS